MSIQNGSRTYDLRFHDPFIFKRELLELGETNVSLTQGRLLHRRADAQQWMNLHFSGTPWNVVVIGNWTSVEYNYTDGYHIPSAVYPSWSLHKNNLKELEDLILNPWGERDVQHLDLPYYEMPVRGQAHKVFIMDIEAKDEPKKLLKLRQIQLAYPEVQFHVVSRNYNVLFGLDFTSGSIQMGYPELALPGGKTVKLSEANTHEGLIRRFGYSPLTIGHNYHGFNIQSARFAAHNWDRATGLSSSRRSSPGLGIKVDVTSPTSQAEQPVNSKLSGFKADRVAPSDKITCDACTLWRMCTSYRKGAVCNLSGTESRKLSQMALSRDAGVITDMLASIVSKQADRVESALEREQFSSDNDIDPTIDKMMNSLFRNGVQLAKLRDPSLGSKIIINTGNQTNNAIVANAEPRAMMANVIKQLEENGVDRQDITEKMVEDVLMGKLTPREAADAVPAAIGSGEEVAVVIEEPDDEPPF